MPFRRSCPGPAGWRANRRREGVRPLGSRPAAYWQLLVLLLNPYPRLDDPLLPPDGLEVVAALEEIRRKIRLHE